VPRTTLDLDATVLRELKRRSRSQGTTAGRLASELLARALAAGESSVEPVRLDWRTGAMHARLDLRDKEALHRALDER
jgi:hypothetical protein